ncbi:hypothetical protein HOI71_23950, partial [Candidatus Poribacteria bacterium]|nr:hypothetical protein [Candidatus Poribacteria bacterium]
MRRIVSVYVLACMVCAVPVIAQGEPEVDILTISRFKDGDKQSGGSSSELVEPVSKKQVLDINGRVHVGIDIDKLKIAIEARRKEDAAGKSEAHLQSLRDVKGVLAGDSSDQQGWALSASAADSLVQLAVQVGNLRDGFTPLTLTPRAEGSTSNMDTLWALGHDVVQLDSDLNALAALAALQTSAEQEMAVYVVLGAWIQKGRRGAGVPVHLPGFDTYEEHTPTDVARWVFALGEGDRKLLEELRKPNTNLGNVVSNLRKHVKACGEALEKAADAQLAQLKGIDSVGKLTEGVTDVAELKKIGEAVGTIAAEVKAIRESLAKVKAAADDLKSWRPPTVAAAIDATRYTSLVDDLVEPISVVREEVEKIVISLKTIK